MKKTLIIFVLFLVGFVTFGQEMELSLEGGLNSPLGKFNQAPSFASSGSNFGLGFQYYLKDWLGFGLQLGTANNPIDKELEDFQNSLLFPTQKIGGTEDWSQTYALLGPVFRFGKNKLSLTVSPKIGYGTYNVPTYSLVYPSEILNENLIIQARETGGSFSSVFSGISAKLNYEIAPNWKLFLKSGVLTNQVFGNKDQKQTIRYKEITDQDGNGAISDEEVISAPNYSDEFCSICTTLQTSIGVSYTFGKPKDRDYPEKIDKENFTCEETILKEPYNGQTYFVDAGLVPEFRWLNHSKPKPNSYRFELYYGNRLVFEKTISTNYLKLTKKMTNELYSFKDFREYSWKVLTYYENCNNTATETQTFTVQPERNIPNRAEGECDYTFTNIEINCESPAYIYENGTTYTLFSGTLTVRNNSTFPGVLKPHPMATNGQNFDVDVSGATLNFSQSGFTSNCPMTPMMSTPNGLAFSPGQQATYCYTLKVPFGTNSLNFLSQIQTQIGTLDEATCNASQTIELPNCICDTCDNWQITTSNQNFWPLNTGKTNMRLRTDFNILNAEPIMQVKAEIVSVQHTVNDPQCYTCTTQDEDMGLFYDSPISGTIYPKNGWQNNGQALNSDDSSDEYFNEFTWRSQTTQGIDFGSTPNKFIIMDINLPPISSMDCCETKYKVCIKYTFTDINCQTCDIVVCYEYDSSQQSVGNGTGVGTGVGNQQNNNGTVLIPNN